MRGNTLVYVITGASGHRVYRYRIRTESGYTVMITAARHADRIVISCRALGLLYFCDTVQRLALPQARFTASSPPPGQTLPPAC